MSIDARLRQAVVFSVLSLAGMPLAAQQAADIGFVTVGRAAPLAHNVNEMERTGAHAFGDGQFIGSARAGEVPPGIESLERDLFTSPDFYVDRELWSDTRYFRCNSPFAIEGLWVGTANPIGDDPPGSAPWGHCDRDYPRESIVSPYPFQTAQAHYEALLEETRQCGGPTEHTQATMPGDEWSGIYRQPRCAGMEKRSDSGTGIR